MNWKILAKWGISLGLLWQLAGCALPGFLTFKGTKLGWSEVTLSAAPGANQNSPIAVDVVLVFEDDMLERLVELPATKWFGVRADLRKTFPKSLSYRTWELVPGQTIQLLGRALALPGLWACWSMQTMRPQALTGCVWKRSRVHSSSASTTRASTHPQGNKPENALTPDIFYRAIAPVAHCSLYKNAHV